MPCAKAIIELVRTSRHTVFTGPSRINATSYKLRTQQWSLRTLELLPTYLQALGLPGRTEYQLLLNTADEQSPWVPASPGPHAGLRFAAAATVHHHDAHALYAFYDSPFRTALVLSVDGGGDDGTCHVYAADRDAGVRKLLPGRGCPWNLGQGFYHAGFAVAPRDGCGGRAPCVNRYATALANMAPEGAAVAAWKQQVRGLFAAGPPGARPNYAKLAAAFVAQHKIARATRAGPKVLSARALRDYAATVQSVLEDVAVEVLGPHAARLADVGGLCLTGGVGFNRPLATRLATAYSVPVHVPPAPGDAGLVAGMVWDRLRPGVAEPYVPPSAFLGLPAMDAARATGLVADLPTAGDGSAETVARLVTDGAAVAVMRGRAEVGPRALGRRSVLLRVGGPGRGPARRQWLQSHFVSVLVPEEHAAQVLRAPVASPHGALLAALRPSVPALGPGLQDPRGYAAVQTVARASDPWLHAVLVALGNATGVPAALNLAFRQASGTWPDLVNTVSQALAVMCREADFLLWDTRLFSRADVQKRWGPGCRPPQDSGS